MGWTHLARVVVPISLAALLGLVATGCGGSSSAAGGDPTTSATSAQDAALEWARCMRKNGVDVGDPKVDANGRIQIQARGPANGNAPQQQTTAQRKAFQACQKILQGALPNGGQPTAAQQAEFQDQALKFAQCMRKHGVDMPDPDFSQGGRGILLQRGNVNPNDPSFKKAQEACQSLLPGRPGAGSRTGGDQ
jgi:hypothetical protein